MQSRKTLIIYVNQVTDKGGVMEFHWPRGVLYMTQKWRMIELAWNQPIPLVAHALLCPGQSILLSILFSMCVNIAATYRTSATVTVTIPESERNGGIPGTFWIANKSVSFLRTPIEADMFVGYCLTCWSIICKYIFFVNLIMSQEIL